MISLYAELLTEIVALFRTDAELHDLLFDAEHPQVADYDSRVYERASPLPENLRQVLPRIDIELSIGPDAYEQPGAGAPAVVGIHSLADQYNSDLADAIDVRCHALLTSTPIRTSRIIAGVAVVQGDRRRDVERLFENAIHYTTVYYYPLVGVVA